MPEETTETEPSTQEPDERSESGAAGSKRRAAGPGKLVFRTPPSAYIAVAFLAMCVSFVAVASPWLLFVYALPVGAAVWVLRTRTEVDAGRIVVRRVLTRTVIPWAAVKSLRLTDKGWLRVVRTDGGEIPLPTVRTRHLSALALISGGRITDPAAEPDQGPV
ncbi:MAG TPA: PH domain-containing protein [Pseudonocardiaceae bacterium]|nr:PH domain-containing protein [Pseudonocardiaceae bacterium]